MNTTFIVGEKSYNSFYDFRLLQQHIEITPAVPRITLVDVPGANGSTDLSEALGTVSYTDRTITWTFALYPELEPRYTEIFSEFANNLNGRKTKIVLSNDTDYYYEGRIQIDSNTKDKHLMQITATATVRPYKMKFQETELTFPIDTTQKSIVLHNERKPVIPTITLSENSVIIFGGGTYNVNSGTHRIPGIILDDCGNYELKVATASGTGTITISYREGSL